MGKTPKHPILSVTIFLPILSVFKYICWYTFIFFYNGFSFNIKKIFMALFYAWGSTILRVEPLRGCSLLFTSRFPEIPGIHFIEK